MQLLSRLWSRVPVIIRAVIGGTLLSAVGHMPQVPLIANVRFFPAVPWGAPLALFSLWLFWEWVGGRWWPASTAETRRQYLRARPLSTRVWRWSLLAGGLAMISLWTLHFVLARLTRSPSYEKFYDLFRTTPFWTMASFIVIASLVAGVSEEAAFRGYMQVPIERRHGPVVATVVVSLIFTLAHYGDTLEMTPSRILFVLVAAVFYSYVAWLTGSILPGLVLHAVGDAAEISILWWLWAAAGGLPLRIRPVPPSTDPIFWLHVAELVVFAAATGLALVKLTRVVRQEPSASMPRS